MGEKEALNATEVAELLGITKNTVYEMAKRGEIPSYKIGKKLRIDKEDVENYISRQKIRRNNEYTEKDDSLVDSNNIIITGQDFLIDVLIDIVNSKNKNRKMFKSSVGSYSSLFDLYNNKVSLCTSHLWNGDTNSYNDDFVRMLLPGVPCLIMNLAYRIQGFYVEKGNPLNINSWEDLLKPEIRFINRERGSGTRVLLDEKIRLKNISSKEIRGYENERNTHLSVASSIKRGEGNVGVGTEKFAKYVDGIDFIPLQVEQYDLVIKIESIESDPIYKEIIEVVKSNEFKNELNGLGGYDLKDIGKIMGRT